MQIDRRKIEIIMAQKRMSRGELTEKAGMRDSTFSAALSRGHARPATVGKISAALGVPVADIIKED